MTLTIAAPFIGSEVVRAPSAPSTPLIDPATEEQVGEHYDASPDQVDQVVGLAAEAQRKWARLSPRRRGELLWRLGDLVAANAEELATLDTLNMGLPLRDSIGGTRGCVDTCRYWAGKADKIWGEQIPSTRGCLSYTSRKPLGVVATITPWNAPAPNMLGRLGPALACGNALIAKPSEFSPLSAVRLAELALEAGIPEGVVSVITGGPAIGELIAGHPGIKGLCFMGSVANGKLVNAAAAPALKKVTLELGGKAPNMVFADANLDEAVRGTVYAVNSRSGQICIAATRLLVEDSIADDFIAAVVAQTQNLRVGHPHEDVHLGPLATAGQYAKVRSYIETAVEDGARVAIGGDRPDSVGDRGYYVAPTVITGVDGGMRVGREEIFGPVLSVFRFGSEEEALAIANDSEYGLSANIWTRDVGRMLRLAEAVEAGVVWGNTSMLIAPSLPFGGLKSSGLGNAFGDGAIEGFTALKRVSIRYDETTPSPAFGD